KANSINPKETFTVFNHPPELGIEFNQLGEMANNVKGSASAKENPNIPMAGPNKAPEFADSTRSVPIIGPVQENETNAKVRAMKKMPINPPLSAPLSDLFNHIEGKVISQAPKKEIAKTTNNIKKAILTQGFVARAFRAPAPKIAVITSPIATYITMIDIP